jgi:hypothetical protein
MLSDKYFDKIKTSISEILKLILHRMCCQHRGFLDFTKTLDKLLTLIEIQLPHQNYYLDLHMKNILSLTLAILAALSSSQATATINRLQVAQTQYLMNQAQFFAQQGVSQENILKIFKQSLAQESLSTDKVETPRSYLIITAGCVVGIMIGGGVVYYFMNKINNQNQARINQLTQENEVIEQAAQNVAQIAQNTAAQGLQLAEDNRLLRVDLNELEFDIHLANNTINHLNTELDELTQGLNFIQGEYEELRHDASIPQPRYTALARINNLLERENTQLKEQLEKLSNDKIIDDFFE